VNLARKTTTELVAMLSHPNKWHRQTAVRLLGERRDPAAKELLKKLLATATAELRSSRREEADSSTVTQESQSLLIAAVAGQASAATRNSHPALEALWALHQAGWLDEPTALAALEHPSAPVRAWAIRLLGDRKQLPGDFAAAVLRLAATEPDAEVRCQIASTARRLPARQALPLIAALVRRDADADDPFIPLLCWFTLESFCDSDRTAVLATFKISPPQAESLRASRRVEGGDKHAPGDSPSPSPLGGERAVRGENGDNRSIWNSDLAKQHILPRLIRRLATRATRADLLVCAQLLDAAPADEHRKLLVAGFEEAFKGRALPPLPDELIASLAASGHSSLLLLVRRGEAEAVRQALTLIGDAAAKREDRLLYIRTLGEIHQPDAVPVLLALATREASVDLRKAALAALSRYDDATIGTDIAAVYAKLPATLHPAAQVCLPAAPRGASLFKLVEAGVAPAANVAADAIARLRRHTDKPVSELTRKFFPISSSGGEAERTRASVASSSPLRGERIRVRGETRAAIERIQQVLKAGTGNPYAGEHIFTERCASCHQLFHKGGRIGPDLTPYQRDDLGTMLPSVLDPNAEIREGFVNYLVETKDERTLSGFIADQDANVVVVRGFDGEDISLARDEIREMNPSGTSLMPEGLLDGLTDEQLRDFFAYLRIPQPISR
jgi:putative heme-binding domain-containing protein